MSTLWTFVRVRTCCTAATRPARRISGLPQPLTLQSSSIHRFAYNNTYRRPPALLPAVILCCCGGGHHQQVDATCCSWRHRDRYLSALEGIHCLQSMSMMQLGVRNLRCGARLLRSGARQVCRSAAAPTSTASAPSTAAVAQRPRLASDVVLDERHTLLDTLRLYEQPALYDAAFT